MNTSSAARTTSVADPLKWAAQKSANRPSQGSPRLNLAPDEIRALRGLLPISASMYTVYIDVRHVHFSCESEYTCGRVCTTNSARDCGFGHALKWRGRPQ